jgi:hypothetical protein
MAFSFLVIRAWFFQRVGYLIAYRLDWEKKSLQYIQMDFKITQVYLILPIHHVIHEFFSHSNKNEFIIEIGTHSEDTMMYQKVNSHTLWNLQFPYNPKLN